MHVQLSGLDDPIDVDFHTDTRGAGYVTFTGTGSVTSFDALVLSHNDPAALLETLRRAVGLVEAELAVTA